MLAEGLAITCTPPEAIVPDIGIITPELSDAVTRRKTQQRVEQLEDELSLLKQLLAEKEMEIVLRDDLLKKYIRRREKSVSSAIHGTGFKTRYSFTNMWLEQKSILSQIIGQKAWA